MVVGLGGLVVDGAGTQGVKLLNPAIRITEAQLTHVLERHTIEGALSGGKSLFNASEDVVKLIQQGTQQVMEKQVGGNFQRVYDTGRNIGTYRKTGEQTSLITIITDIKNNLVTAFPGRP